MTLRRLPLQRKNRDNLDYGIVEIGQKTQESPEETCFQSDSSESPPANTGEKDPRNKCLSPTIILQEDLEFCNTNESPWTVKKTRPRIN